MRLFGSCVQKFPKKQEPRSYLTGTQQHIYTSIFIKQIKTFNLKNQSGKLRLPCNYEINTPE